MPEAVRWTLGLLLGAALTGALVKRGLHQLGLGRASAQRPRWVGTIAGCAAGAAATEGGMRAGTWLVVPALMVWACALVAAAVCDAITQRVPTGLVRQACAVTGVLLVISLSLDGDWRGLLMSGLAAGTCHLTVLLCWRFAGAGFGDVRLAALGGLGLGHATIRGGGIAVAALCVVILAQVIQTLARGGNRHSRLPMGPALAVAFLLATAL